ncbi:hypothetical protein [Salibacterium aidingense]|uniref:hypothetical protein n=1 Tax=Salibacterium aidingense TaxID=384933 RepID=UPI0003FFE99F|nr:hypothetical protein [Salibacterium aidingense]
METFKLTNRQMETALKVKFDLYHMEGMYQEDDHARYFLAIIKEELPTTLFFESRLVTVDIKVEHDNERVSMKELGQEDWEPIGMMVDY